MAAPSLQLQGATLEVYQALCALKTAKVGAVREALEQRGRELAYTTVQTVLNRLEGRGFVKTSREGKAIVYRPLIPLSRVRRARVSALVDELYRDDVGPLVLQLMRTRSLSADDLDELRALVAKHKPRRGKSNR